MKENTSVVDEVPEFGIVRLVARVMRLEGEKVELMASAILFRVELRERPVRVSSPVPVRDIEDAVPGREGFCAVSQCGECFVELMVMCPQKWWKVSVAVQVVAVLGALSPGTRVMVFSVDIFVLVGELTRVGVWFSGLLIFLVCVVLVVEIRWNRIEGGWGYLMIRWECCFESGG